jgi:predicted transcriptional regulator
LSNAENILISVEQKYVARMLSGYKKVELRRRPFRVPIGTRIWIYSKAPRAAVGAVAKLAMIASAPPEELWEKYGDLAGVTKKEFDSYFSNANMAWAIFLEDICELPTAVTLATLRRHSELFQPPQFFKRLEDGSDALDLLLGTMRFQTPETAHFQPSPNPDFVSILPLASPA